MPPVETPSLTWTIAEHFGFPASMVVLLIYFLMVRGREHTAELGRLTRAVTLVVLAMSFAPKQFRESAREIYDESLSEAHKRKENLEDETKRHHP